MSHEEAVPQITPAELRARMDRGDAPVLVDVREHFERRIADLPERGQIRMPAGEVLERMGELEGHAEVVLYCRSGSRSEWAVKLLRSRGVRNLVNLKGGLLAWREEVDPTVRAY